MLTGEMHRASPSLWLSDNTRLPRPFVDKLNEVTANGITVISAIGNDGAELHSVQ